VNWSAGIVADHEVDLIWGLALPLLQPGIDRSGGRISAETVLEAVHNKTNLLWLISNESEIAAAFTTRVAKYPLKSMLVVECLGGDRMQEWVEPVNETLLRFAKDCGLSGVEMYGREGWTKALAPYGWKRSMVLCEVGLEQETADV
jgi:hypothetical protein